MKMSNGVKKVVFLNSGVRMLRNMILEEGYTMPWLYSNVGVCSQGWTLIMYKMWIELRSAITSFPFEVY